MPTAASTPLSDLGLTGLVATVRLQPGQQRVAESGLSIFLIGVDVTILTMLIRRYVLRSDNVAVFVGALSGSRRSNPAFGENIEKARNYVQITFLPFPPRWPTSF